jgi:hypothetical protein
MAKNIYISGDTKDAKDGSLLGALDAIDTRTI